MRILYLAQFFITPGQPGSTRAWMTARYFGSKGHEVNVLASQLDYMTGHNKKDGKKHDSEELELPDGVSLKKINTIFNGKSKIKRLMQYVVYCLLSLIYGLKAAKPDVVLATSPPIFVGLIGCWLAKIRGARYIFEIRDPWPDALIYFGVLKESLFTRLLFWIEMYIYKKADLLIALTPGIKRMIVQKGIPAEKIEVVTNGYDEGIFDSGHLKYEKPQKTEKTTKVIYVGSMGQINETEYLMEIAIKLKDTSDIKLEFIGEGICKQNMVKTAREHNLTNVRILDPVSKEKVPAVLATGDIAIVATKPGLYSEIGLHNKIFDYLGAGLPVVSLGKGDVKQLLDSAGAGFAVESRDVEGAVEKIKQLSFNKDLARKMGISGREYILKHCRREQLLVKYEEYICKLVTHKNVRSMG